ncbi:MAG: hypothetical protein LBD74_01365 [Spirochaetaceae bacterium]|jgi:hypothetical protein|nr:hypothetical protein [Spirochaetaceae bacterium]
MHKLRMAGLLVLGLYALGRMPGAENEPPGSSVPEALRRPQRGEAPRYPQDTIIGPLGRGEAQESAYAFAVEALKALVRNTQNTAVVQGLDGEKAAEYQEVLQGIKAHTFRIGSGRKEADGSTSFVVRFVGRDQWISGELYLYVEEGAWKVEELILEEAQDTKEGNDPYPVDYAPYERLF